MDRMSIIIAKNIKAMRQERKLSLDAVSELTGVSKSMLGQIERGESSPTIATLWKIATGLSISFTALVEESKKQTEIVKNEDIDPLLNNNGLMRIYPVFPYESSKNFEILFMEMDSEACSPSQAHTAGTEEYVIVFEGAVSITIDQEEYVIYADNSIRYFADKAHCYRNAYDGKTRFCMLIYYKN